MKQSFQRAAASPYRNCNSRQSRAVRHAYLALMLLAMGGVVISLAAGLISA